MHHFTGIRGRDGRAIVPAMSTPELAQQIKQGIWPFADALLQATNSGLESFGLPFGIQESDYVNSGWGVVFPEGCPETVKKALEPLLMLRQIQVRTGLCRALPVDKPTCNTGPLEYKKSEDQDLFAFLRRHGVTVGNIEPTRLPYYLLLIGPPTEIPFHFQYLLDQEYIVGRLPFPLDRPDLYANYARSIASWEDDTIPAPSSNKSLAFFAPRMDKATIATEQMLVGSLADGFPGGTENWHRPIAAELGYRTISLRVGDARKQALSELLHDPAQRPSLLFAATHGIQFGYDPSVPTSWAESELASTQGALLTQDWLGFEDEPVKPGDRFAAADLADDADLSGLIAFQYACYGAGTPKIDDFDRGVQLAPEPFVAALPQRMLGLEKGALAVIGHVDRAWTFFEPGPELGAQITPYRNCLGHLMLGKPVGFAMNDINGRSTLLSSFSRGLFAGMPSTTDDAELVRRWTELHDARNWILLGDPAVRLRS